ncbi:MAG: hypothetical protein Q8O76_07775, partial [Chloroflexota bacterium]|nr:hypothetical protein [Chloroflexota bacterium]
YLTHCNIQWVHAEKEETMSRTQELIERERERILGEAREELEKLKRSADTTVKEAAEKLEGVFVLVEEAGKRMGALGVSSVADILLSGGFIYVDRVRNSSPYACADVFDWLGRANSAQEGRTPSRSFSPGEKHEYEVLLLLTPVGKKD